MKTKNVFLSLITVIFLLFTVQNLSAQDNKKKGKETVTFLIETMHCENCKAKIEKNIAFEKGVTDIQTDLENKTVSITYKADKTNPENLRKGFEKIGYNAIEMNGNKKE